jgi:hypothetical protein
MEGGSPHEQQSDILREKCMTGLQRMKTHSLLWRNNFNA